MRERTLAAPVEFSGIGLHTGEPVQMRVLPAPPGKGIVFRRVDLDNFEMRADVTSVSRVAYATTLMKTGVWISTVEHLLSALYGMSVDNAYVEIDNLEVPILDGSARPYTDALAQVGLLEQPRSRKCIRITRPFVIDDNGKYLGIFPADGFFAKYSVDFKHPLIGRQEFEVDCSGNQYATSIAPARTFGFYNEVEMLQASGLVRGGSLENAIVLTETGMLNDVPLRYPDEFVRHKILDLLGDFALIGRPVLGRLVANKAGHALHTRFVGELLKRRECWVMASASVRGPIAPVGGAVDYQGVNVVP